MDANVHEGEGLTPQAAVAEIRRIEGLHGALARRASGLTWMIWGIVAPAIFISYALLGILVGFPGNGNGYHALWVLFPVLWAPWAAIGLVATATLWRSVGLVIPRRSARMREGVLTGAIIVGIIFAGFAAIAVTKVPVVEFAWVLMAQGLGVVTVGLLGLNCNDATERRLWILGGILLVATALVGSLLLGGEILLARQWVTLISPLTSGLVLFGGTLRSAPISRLCGRIWHSRPWSGHSPRRLPRRIVRPLRRAHFSIPPPCEMRCRADCPSTASRRFTTRRAAWRPGRWPASSRSSWTNFKGNGCLRSGSARAVTPCLSRKAEFASSAWTSRGRWSSSVLQKVCGMSSLRTRRAFLSCRGRSMSPRRTMCST